MQLHRSIDAIRARGAELVVIGNGQPQFIAGFRDQTGYDGLLYTDPSLVTYQAMALPSGLRTVLTLGALVRTVGAFRRGFRQGRTRGAPLQQGGALVVAVGGKVLFRHVSRGPGDNADAGAIVASLSSK